MADGEGFEPSVHCCTHAFQACAIDHSATHPESALSKHWRLVLRKPLSVICHVPEFNEEQPCGNRGDEAEDDEEEVDECVHAREQNTGGQTLVVLSLKNVPAGNRTQI